MFILLIFFDGMNNQSKTLTTVNVHMLFICLLSLLLTPCVAGMSVHEVREENKPYPTDCDLETRYARSSCSTTCGRGKQITDVYCRKGLSWYYKEEYVPCNTKPCAADSGNEDHKQIQKLLSEIFGKIDYSPGCVTSPYGPCRRVGTSCIQYMYRQCHAPRRSSVTVQPCNKC